MVARNPNQGGATWAVLQYVLGLRRLGHKVLLAEPIDNPSWDSITYFDNVCSAFGVDGQIVSPKDELAGFDAVLNISGMLPPTTIAPIPTRIYMDLDPAFNQLWQADGIDRGMDGHTHFVTVGQAIGQEMCDVPTLSRTWIHTLPPVVLENWKPTEAVKTDAFTTVANLRSYGSIQRHGVLLGQKVHSLRRLVNLPRRSGEDFVLAMSVHPDERDDLAALEAGGWKLTDPETVAGTPFRYRDFIRGSRAEIGVAKSGYVVSRCGWFSDRSACYLASGRPVVAQDTGFSRFIPTGVGLLTFDDEDSAIEAIEEVVRDYDRHARCALELAIEHFDSDRVLTSLLDRTCR